LRWRRRQDVAAGALMLTRAGYVRHFGKRFY
jgi:hypothetical protein